MKTNKNYGLVVLALAMGIVLTSCRSEKLQTKINDELGYRRLKAWCVESSHGWMVQLRYTSTSKDIEAARITLLSGLSESQACESSLADLGVFEFKRHFGIIEIRLEDETEYLPMIIVNETLGTYAGQSFGCCFPEEWRYD